MMLLSSSRISDSHSTQLSHPSPRSHPQSVWSYSMSADPTLVFPGEANGINRALSDAKQLGLSNITFGYSRPQM